jgi:hypothetical protein
MGEKTLCSPFLGANPTIHKFLEILTHEKPTDPPTLDEANPYNVFDFTLTADEKGRKSF